MCNSGGKRTASNGTVGDEKRSDGGGTKLDRLFRVLTEERRRYILYYLREEEETADLDRVAEQVAAWECGTSTDEVSDEHCDRVRTDLYHTHLPMLADLGIAEYDPRSSALRYRDPPDALERILDVCIDVEYPENDRTDEG